MQRLASLLIVKPVTRVQCPTMRANNLFLVLALLAAPALSVGEEEKKDADSAAAELLEVSESSNNNTAAADEEPAVAESSERTNSKRTIDHNLGYGYRYNTVLRPVPMSSPLGRPGRPYPSFYPSGMFKGARYLPGPPGPSSAPHFDSPYRFSQPLSSPMEKPREEPRPVTEPSAQHESTYRTLPQALTQSMPAHGMHHQDTAPQSFSYEDEPSQPEAATQTQSLPSSVPEQQHHHSILASQAPSYQQVIQQLQLQHTAAEPEYILSQSAVSPASMFAHSHMYPGSTPTPLMFSHAAAASASAPQMIPILIVRVMDPQAVASAHQYSALPSPAPMPYPLMNMNFLRDYISKLYTQPQPVHYVPAPEQETFMYLTGSERPSSLYRAAHMQKLQQQIQAQLQLQAQIQAQQQQQQQQQQQRQSAAAVLQEQHRQRVAAAQGRTEVSVHHSAGMTPQDYKDSVEQQEES